MQTAPSPRGSRRWWTPSSSVPSFVGYTAIFAALSFAWLREAHRGSPAGFLGNAADERLVVWVLAWVAHALATPSLGVLDANINHPAPAQLTGTEHFGTFQVLFAPLYALTDNPLLAANLTVFLTYPLAALAMQRLLLALGCSAGAAWVVGLVFAVGPFRVPAHLHLLQYTNLFLPLVALSLTRLRSRPEPGRAALVALALVAAALSSYYMALLAGVLAAAWGLFELFGRREARLRFLVLAGAAAVVAGAVVLFVSWPWLSRPEVEREVEFSFARAAVREYNLKTFASRAVRSAGKVALVVGGLGVAGLLVRDRVARLLATRGLLLTLFAQFTAIGALLTVGETQVLTPFVLVEASPARFFRYPFRFAVLLGFGTSLLAAAALRTVSVTLGRQAARVAVAVVAILLVATHAWKLPGKRIDAFVEQTEPAYEMVARLTRARGPGPLLELPIVAPIADEERVLGTEVGSMLGSTRHWLPLVAGFTGYQPPHRPFVLREIDQLPDPRALQRLVDMTRVRWILLQPADRWPERRLAQREKIRKSRQLRHIATEGGWVLLRVKATARDVGWYEAIAAGPRPDRTILGTSLAPIAEEDAVAVVSGSIQNPMPAGGVGVVALSIRNDGAAPWPMSVPTGQDECERCVRVLAEWWPAGAERRGAPVKRQRLVLPIDVPPKEEIAFTRWVAVPRKPGDYDLRLSVVQTNGATFSKAGNGIVDVRVTVAPQPKKRGRAPARKPA